MAKSRGTTTILLKALRAYVFLGSGGSLLSCVSAGGLYGQPGCSKEQLEKYPSGWPEKLDWGIYWFGKSNQFEKAIPGTAGKFYDPSKKTIVYIHGWEGSGHGTISTCSREDGIYRNQGWEEEDVPTSNFLDYWLLQDWNVGFFYWDQFADEPCARDAEAKIWGGNEAEGGLRWKSRGSGEQWQTYNAIKDITELCVYSVEQTMSDFRGPMVRFAGHSIGSQLAIRCASLLHDRANIAAPSRIALLDPFFTRQGIGIGCKHLGTPAEKSHVAEETAKLVQMLWEKFRVTTEIYKSSAFTQNTFLGDPNPELESAAAVVLREPAWCGTLQWACRHFAVVPLYFGSMASGPPTQVATLGKASGECPVPSASCNQEQITALVTRQINLQKLNQVQRWRQVDGGSTLTCDDDTFELEIGSASHVQLDDDASRTAVQQLPVASHSTSLTWILPIVGACLAISYAAFTFIKRQTQHAAEEEPDEEETAAEMYQQARMKTRGDSARRVDGVKGKDQIERTDSSTSSQASERRGLLMSSR